jgi:PTH1 family peptidyl-tRNA hydrolase
MNESGRAVAELMRFYQVADEELMIVLDDLDLPFGRLRLRGTGSAGGQRGLASIIAWRGSARLARLRIGIGRPPAGMPAERYVLLPFLPAEQPLLPTILSAAADALELWLEAGLTPTMTRFNGWQLPIPPT